MNWVWTNDPPEEEGYYWYRDEYICDIVRVYNGLGEEVRVTGTLMHECKPIGNLEGQWAGPVAEPNNPQVTS